MYHGDLIGYDAFYQCTSLETVVLPDSLKVLGKQSFSGAEAALASNFRCTDSTEVSIQCRTIPMYVTETRIMELYNDDGSAKWATTDEGILSVDEYGFITANAVGNATITVNVNGKTYSYDFKVIERTTENVLSVIFKYYVTEDMTDYEKVLACKSLDRG